MAKLTLETESPPGGPESQGLGPDPQRSGMGKASPSSGRTPQDRAFST